jgi:hypothetical protein
MDLAAKLQLKPGQYIEVQHAPDSVSSSLEHLAQSTADATSALLVFVSDSATLEEQRDRIVSAVSDQRLTWVLYPKAGQLGTDLNRNILVSQLEESGIQPVRQIAIDDVWSALRFRPSA